MRTLKTFFVTAAAVVLLSAAAHAQATLKLSHQFPGGKGDIRDDMALLVAKEVKAANVGLNVQVYPGASLFKPNDQWNAIVNGQLDITVFPLDYASGKVPTFSATLMPGLIRSQERAKRINKSPFMTAIRAEIAKQGVVVLADAWFAGGLASRDGCITKPAEMKGRKIRAAGPTFAGMWAQAGASIVSPPSNEIYNAFQSNVINGTDTSLTTFASMRLYEVAHCLAAPGENALWFMYQPMLMSKKSFDKLNKQQQDAVIAAGKKAEALFESKADAVNKAAVKTFEDNKVKVVTLTDADYAAWLEVAKKSSYAKFAKDVPNGQKLIDDALAVK
jgi:TRAP-type C4-dicarboxylate transport system substrate-binding protein